MASANRAGGRYGLRADLVRFGRSPPGFYRAERGAPVPNARVLQGHRGGPSGADPPAQAQNEKDKRL